jgi:hypothetical protein
MPNDSARSLSTLIALKIASEKSAMTMLKEYHRSSATRQKFHRWLTAAKREATATGCTTSPTQRSENAKQRRNSLEGGLRDDSLWRATKINAFPRVVVMDNATFIPDIAKSRVGSFEELRCTGKVRSQRKPACSE